MSRIKRKVVFCNLHLTSNPNNIDVQQAVNLVFDHINGLDKVNRKKVLSEKKFGLLDSINSNQNNDKHKLIFKSASHSHRPPLIDKTTVLERVSPKTIDEGETLKTHLILKYISGDVIIVSEKHFNGMSVKQIVDYFNYFTSFLEGENSNIRFSHTIILKEDFLEEIENLTRITSAEIFVDKQLLGSDALDFSERINPIQHEISIKVKANRMDSILDFSRDVFSLFSGGQQIVRKIRLEGRNNENNVVNLNTELLEKQEYVTVDKNDETGELISNDLLRELDTIIYNNYN